MSGGIQMSLPSSEVVTNILALIALLISLYSLHKTSTLEKRGHEFVLFQEVYQNYLVKKIPEARANIIITQSGKIQGIDQFTSTLTDLRKISLYFKFSDPDFFENLKNTMWRLEDYLVMAQEPLLGDARYKFEVEVDARLNNIYQCLLKKL